MNKAILISIKPKYVADILNGRKTIEIRKTMPKCDLPIDVYIYCSKGGKKDWHLIEVVDTDTGWEGFEYDYYIGSKGYLDWCFEGKVVAKFTLNKISHYVNGVNWEYLQKGAGSYDDFETILEPSCLTEEELYKYVEDLSFSAWHIDNLVIFDKPKELNDFYGTKQYFIGCENGIDKTPRYSRLTKAPQSYCFIETEVLK